LIGAGLPPSKYHSFYNENAPATETILEAVHLEPASPKPKKIFVQNFNLKCAKVSQKSLAISGCIFLAGAAQGPGVRWETQVI